MGVNSWFWILSIVKPSTAENTFSSPINSRTFKRSKISFNVNSLYSILPVYKYLITSYIDSLVEGTGIVFASSDFRMLLLKSPEKYFELAHSITLLALISPLSQTNVSIRRCQDARGWFLPWCNNIQHIMIGIILEHIGHIVGHFFLVMDRHDRYLENKIFTLMTEDLIHKFSLQP